MTDAKLHELLLKAQGAKSAVAKQADTLRRDISQQEHRMHLLEEAQVFLQGVAQSTQEKLCMQIEDVVNMALETCFPNEYTFGIDFDIKYGKTEANIYFVSQRTGQQVDPMQASGGGVVDLTSFALRIAGYALEQGNDNVIILDEPFRFLSRDLQRQAGEILKNLSKTMGIQIIMVTHIGDIIDVADKVFEVRKTEKGFSKVTSYEN